MESGIALQEVNTTVGVMVTGWGEARYEPGTAAAQGRMVGGGRGIGMNAIGTKRRLGS